MIVVPQDKLTATQGYCKITKGLGTPSKQLSNNTDSSLTWYVLHVVRVTEFSASLQLLMHVDCKMICTIYVQANPALCLGTLVPRQKMEAEATEWWQLYLAVEIVEAGAPSSASCPYL